MENYGETFKTIRINKGYTLKEVAEGIISVQYLSKFEKNETNITVHKLNDLLNKVLVSWQEFMRIHGGNNIDSFNAVSGTVNQLIYSKKYYELDKLAATYEAQYAEFGYIKDLHFALIIRSSYSGIVRKVIPDEQIEDVRRYLTSIDQWYSYENFLFGSFIFMLSVDDIMQYYNRVVKNFLSRNERSDSELSELIELVSFIVSYLVPVKELTKAEEVIRYTEEAIFIENDPRAMFYKTVLKSKMALIKILRGKVEEGKTELLGYIKALELIGGYSTVANSMFFDLERTLQKVEKSKL